MKRNLKLIQKRRKFAESYKKKLVKDFESGRYSVRQLSKLHNIAEPTIYNWIYKYSQMQDKSVRVVEIDESSSEKLKKLTKELADLERRLGQKQIQLDYLEELINVAESTHGISIKKNCDTKR